MKMFQKHKVWARFFSCILAACLLFSNSGLTASALEEDASVITISNRADLEKIGKDSNYPMSGDYKLTADIDLSGSNWMPFGGYIGTKGTCNPSEANVFSGTFDGGGHVISGLTIDLDGSIEAGKYGQVGFFSVIGSNNSDDYAEVKNLIFTGVDIQTDFADEFSSIGTLAGDVNGYAKISNIAVLSGSLAVNLSKKSDTVGAGGIIGECRTDAPITNNNISITNCYNGADINAAGSVERLIYASGIIGRIAKSACKEVSQCVNTGIIQYSGYDANGIAFAENNNTDYLASVTNCYFLDYSGGAACSGTIAVSESELTSGNLPANLPAEAWKAVSGCYPVPAFCYDSSAASEIYLSGISLGFAEGEKLSGVSTEITLPQEFGGKEVNWESSDPVALTIEAGKAIAHPDAIRVNTVVTLTAVIESKSREFKITVLTSSEKVASFNQGYAEVGTKLEVSVSNTEDMDLTYEWVIDKKVVSETKEYTPKKEDLEKFITVTITPEDSSAQPWVLKTYCSELPVVYVDTEDREPVTSNTVTKDAWIKIQGNAEFNDSSYWYEGATTIKGRGNSTWSEGERYGKKPYKLKLDKKSNLLGLGTHGKGTNKHWCLLANLIDHTNMRNQIVNQLSEDIGMEVSIGTTSVVLILNGEYQGLYELCEHVRVGGARVDVMDWEDLADEVADKIAKAESLDEDVMEEAMEQDLSWIDTGTFTYNGKTYTISNYYTKEIPKAEGGFLLDMDFRSTQDQYKYISIFSTSNGIPMFFRSPEYAKTNATMLSYAKNYLNAYEAALKSPDFTTSYNDSTVHYTDLFDLDSLVQYWLICEYTNNWDSMKNSTYLYKDLEGKAKMGPAWDYDWAFGNINMYSMVGPFIWDQWHTTLTGTYYDYYLDWSGQPTGFAEQSYQYNQWNRYLVKDPYFVAKAYEYWETYYPTVITDISKSGGTIDTLKEKYQTAAEANDAFWGWSYGSYRGYAFNSSGNQISTSSQTYDDAIISLKAFIEKRTDWMNTQFKDIDTLYKSLGNSVSNKISVSLEKEIDQPFTAEANVSDSSIKYVTFLVNGTRAADEDGNVLIQVEDGKAVITVDSADLDADKNAWNVIEVLGVDASGTYINSGSVMNFTSFRRADYPGETLAGTVMVQTDNSDAEVSYPGNTLTAKVDSNNSGTLSYQWYAGETAIEGANEAAYKLTADEIGKSITVKVESTEEIGELTGTYTGTVAEKPVNPDNPNNPNNPEITVLTGTVTVQTDSSEAGVSYPGDTLTAAVTGSNNSGTLTYQWYAGGTEIEGANGAAYKLTADEIGKTIIVKVTSTKETGELTGTYTGTVAEKPGNSGSAEGTDGSGNTEKPSTSGGGTGTSSGTNNTEKPTTETPSGTNNMPQSSATGKITEVKLSATTKSLQVYGTVTLKATVLPSTASQKVTWSSSKPSVAKVSSSGKVTAKSSGKAVITATAEGDKTRKASCTITVLKPTLKITGKATVKQKKSITLTATAKGLKGTITWKLDAQGKKLLKLSKSKGKKVKLTAKKKSGTAKLTISCGGKKVTKKIKVKK